MSKRAGSCFSICLWNDRPSRVLPLAREGLTPGYAAIVQCGQETVEDVGMNAASSAGQLASSGERLTTSILCRGYRRALPGQEHSHSLCSNGCHSVTVADGDRVGGYPMFHSTGFNIVDPGVAIEEVGRRSKGALIHATVSLQQALLRRGSVAEYSAAFLKLFLVDLAACKPLLENIERRAPRLHMRPVPRPAKPAHQKDSERDHHG